MTRGRSSRGPELLIPIKAGAGSLRYQIEHAIRDAAQSGRLPAGTILPSTRILAQDLGLSRGVVVNAYEQLRAEGFLITRPAGHTEVAPLRRLVFAASEPATFAGPRYDFRPGIPDVREFPHEDWSRSARRALRKVRPADLGYGDAGGAVALRSSLSHYLGRVRGVVTAPAQILVCTGFAQVLRVVSKALARRSVRVIAIEDPASPDLRHFVSDPRLEVVSVPVDEKGLRTSKLAETKAQAVVLTPAHQFPTGYVLSPERRRELLEWAEKRNGYILEDDYDAEYRYDGHPIGALQGLAPGRVFYAGSASKLLAPALRLGWLCVPPDFIDVATEEKRLADLGTPLFEQLVYAEFLESGSLDAHLRRMRRLYRSRRDALTRALHSETAKWEVVGAAAGLHLVARLAPGNDERWFVDKAAGCGVRVYPMSFYRRAKPKSAPQELVLGYAHLTEREIADGLRAICE